MLYLAVRRSSEVVEWHYSYCDGILHFWEWIGGSVVCDHSCASITVKTWFPHFALADYIPKRYPVFHSDAIYLAMVWYPVGLIRLAYYYFVPSPRPSYQRRYGFVPVLNAVIRPTVSSSSSDQNYSVSQRIHALSTRGDGIRMTHLFRAFPRSTNCVRVLVVKSPIPDGKYWYHDSRKSWVESVVAWLSMRVQSHDSECDFYHLVPCWLALLWWHCWFRWRQYDMVFVDSDAPHDNGSIHSVTHQWIAVV